VEGAGGGHAPDLIRLAGVNNILTSSTTPTVPYTVSTYQEHYSMTSQVHNINITASSEAAALDERLRRQTMAAEDVLHDMGAVPIINSDSQGMGRIGEVITRTWQLAHKMKQERGDAGSENDNERILQYLAKYTINPAITHGISSYVGSLEPGKMADVVLWNPAFFGIKPDTVIKGGIMTWSPTGEGNATIRQSEPVIYGPSFGALGNSPSRLSAFFVSQASLELNLKKQLRTMRKLLPVKEVRTVTKRCMVRNSLNPAIEVDIENKQVRVDGEVVTSNAVTEVPLNRLYNLA
jgi:urease subunit alpha